MTTLDLGALVGRVTLDDLQWRTTYVRVVSQMANLGAQAETSSAGTATLDGSLTGVAGASTAAATGLGGVNTALTETGASASRAALAIGRAVDVTTEAGLATSKLTQSTLRQVSAEQRLTELQATGTASTRQLAAAQASLIAANDRVALSQERVAESQMFGARSADRMRSAWGKVPGPVKAGAAALAFGAFEALKAASNYQKLTVNLVTGAGESQRNLKMVSDGMLSMAGAVGDSAETLAKAMFLVESAGFHGAAGLTILKTAAQGAKVDGADLTSVVDALTSAMNAYHEPARRAATVTNTLIAGAAEGKLHLQDLATDLGNIIPTAAALHIPLDQVVASIANMTASGMPVARATTAMRFAFSALAGPTAVAQKAMASVGLTSDQVANTLTHGGLPAALTLITEAVGQKFPAGSAKYFSALKNIVGGTRGMQFVLDNSGKSLGTFEARLAAVQARVHDAGNSVSDWGEVQKNLNVQWSEFIDGLGAAGIKIGEDLIPVATSLLQVLNGTGHVIGAVTGFLEHNETVATGLAVVLGAMLAPAALRVAAAFAWGALEGASQLVLALLNGVPRLAAGLTALGGSALVAKAGILLLAYAALNAFNDIRNGNAVINELHSSLNKPLTGNLFSDLSAAQAAISDGFAKANHSGENFFGHMASWVTHPVQTFNDAIGNTADGVKATQEQLDAAYGSFRGLVLAMHKWPTPDAEQQTAMVISQMGLSVTDLATKNFPGLLTQVRAWIAANRQSHNPAEQAHTDIVALGSGALSAADEVKALTSALDLFAGNAISADQGAIAFRNDLVALDKALRKSHGSLSLDSQAGRDARDAFDSAAQQALNTAEAQAKLKGGTDKARATLQEEIRTLRDHAGSSDYAKQAIGRLTTALNNLPSTADGKRQGQNFGAGYAAGINSMVPQVSANAAEMAQAAADAAKRKQKSHSPSLVAMKIGQDFGAGMALGIDSTQQHVANSAKQMATAAVNAAKSVLDSAKAKLTADISVRAQAASGITSTLFSGLDLSQAVVNQHVGNLSAFLRAGTVPLERLLQDETKLRKRGLDPRLMAQIANAGPNAGLALAQSILMGRSGSIAHLDRLEQHAQAYAKATGRLVAHAQYDPRIERDRQDVHDSLLELRTLNTHVGDLKRILKENPHLTGRELAAALDGWVGGLHHKAQSRTSR